LGQQSHIIFCIVSFDVPSIVRHVNRGVELLTELHLVL